MSGIKFGHFCIIGRNIDALAVFYTRALGCFELPTGGTAEAVGEWADEVTGLPGCHMRLSGSPGAPTIELIEFSGPQRVVDANNSSAAAHGTVPPCALGLRHVAFVVDDLAAAVKNVLDNGGTQMGPLASPPEAKFKLVYCRDPEGNIVELMQLLP
ncbi:hypothetical protein Pelo_5252 [Pelomyxa schiedti]|nr:hypothetical protein Pelo_5252 [Pelomyxa schiedti]